MKLVTPGLRIIVYIKAILPMKAGGIGRSCNSSTVVSGARGAAFWRCWRHHIYYHHHNRLKKIREARRGGEARRLGERNPENRRAGIAFPQ